MEAKVTVYYTEAQLAAAARSEEERLIYMADAAPALLARLKLLRDSFGVALPLDWVEKVIHETDTLIATVSPGWPKRR